MIMAAMTACAAEITGIVVAVQDGDTIRVLDSDNVQHEVRLAEIDAPEKRQPFGEQSKRALSALCYKRRATVLPLSRDRYGRTVGRVACDETDVNAEQVRVGMAWVYDRYVTDRSLYQLQNAAHGAEAGLWSQPDPIPPWKWRNLKR